MVRGSISYSERAGIVGYYRCCCGPEWRRQLSQSSRLFSTFQQGYGKQVFLDENTDLRVYGFVRAQLAEEFVAHISGSAAGKVYVCPIRGDSMFEEAAHVDKCVSQYGARSVLLVTSDYHTRRALATFKRILPRYHWSVAASEDSAEFGKNWWEHREWAKRTVTEWSEFIWWEGVDQWR